jgi:hypothetical protein
MTYSIVFFTGGIRLIGILHLPCRPARTLLKLELGKGISKVHELSEVRTGAWDHLAIPGLTTQRLKDFGQENMGFRFYMVL